MRRDSVIIGLFALSGAAGLVYEVVWARQLVLVFGNTTQAVSAILTGFFGGMAIGAYVGGRLADRVRRGLLLYGCLEILVAIVAVATPLIFGLIGTAYQASFGALDSTPAVLSVVRFGLALAALAPATVLLGATLPTLTRYLSRDGAHLSVAFGRLYAANTIGAVFGCMLAGLIFIELLGLDGALRVGAACSAAAGCVAIALHFRGVVVDARATELVAHRATTITSRPMLALAIAFISGLTSLSYQTLWTRLLADGSGNLTYVFTLILTVFLVGLASGADAFNALRSRLRDPVRALALLQAATGLLVLAGLVLVIGRPDPTVGRHNLLGLGLATLVVVLPTTFVMGLSLPIAGLLAGRTHEVAGADTGRLLAANTVGAIVGTIGVPFVLIPSLGSPGALVAVSLVSGLTAAVLGLSPRIPWGVRRSWPAALGFAALGLAAVISVSGGILDPTVNRVDQQGGTIYASAEDEIASVQAGALDGKQQLWVAGSSMTYLTVDARLMPLLPLMLRPDSKTALTVAFGMGSAYREALVAGLKTDAVELVPSVPGMFGWYFTDAQQVLADPRGRVIIADGRNYIELSDRTYDIIVVDPPPPIQSSGASVISSLEFYQAASRRLNPGGVMMQWVPIGQTVDEFRAAVRTFASVFPNVIVAVGPGGNGYFMLGSDGPLRLDPSNVQSILSRPGIVHDLSSAYDSPTMSLDGWAAEIPALVRLSGTGVMAFAGSGPYITDDDPLPEYFLLRQTFGSGSPDLTPQSLGTAPP